MKNSQLDSPHSSFPSSSVRISSSFTPTRIRYTRSMTRNTQRHTSLPPEDSPQILHNNPRLLGKINSSAKVTESNLVLPSFSELPEKTYNKLPPDENMSSSKPITTEISRNKDSSGLENLEESNKDDSSSDEFVDDTESEDLGTLRKKKRYSVTTTPIRTPANTPKGKRRSIGKNYASKQSQNYRHEVSETEYDSNFEFISKKINRSAPAQLESIIHVPSPINNGRERLIWGAVSEIEQKFVRFMKNFENGKQYDYRNDDWDLISPLIFNTNLKKMTSTIENDYISRVFLTARFFQLIACPMRIPLPSDKIEDVLLGRLDEAIRIIEQTTHYSQIVFIPYEVMIKNNFRRFIEDLKILRFKIAWKIDSKDLEEKLDSSFKVPRGSQIKSICRNFNDLRTEMDLLVRSENLIELDVQWSSVRDLTFPICRSLMIVVFIRREEIESPFSQNKARNALQTTSFERSTSKNPSITSFEHPTHLNTNIDHFTVASGSKSTYNFNETNLHSNIKENPPISSSEIHPILKDTKSYTTFEEEIPDSVASRTNIHSNSNETITHSNFDQKIVASISKYKTDLKDSQNLSHEEQDLFDNLNDKVDDKFYEPVEPPRNLIVWGQMYRAIMHNSSLKDPAELLNIIFAQKSKTAQEIIIGIDNAVSNLKEVVEDPLPRIIESFDTVTNDHQQSNEYAVPQSSAIDKGKGRAILFQPDLVSNSEITRKRYREEFVDDEFEDHDFRNIDQIAENIVRRHQKNILSKGHHLTATPEIRQPHSAKKVKLDEDGNLQRRTRWTQDEIDSLEEAMENEGSSWAGVLDWDKTKGSVRLQRFTQMQLKDKARNIRKNRENAGQDLGPFKYASKSKPKSSKEGSV
ncbi:hypothetical protein HK096_001996, partial [Nowakowskiella sp. JEL0078]